MTEEQIKNFPKNAEEYFYKQLNEGLPYKKEIANFFEVMNYLRNEIKGQKEYIKYLKKKRQGGIQKQYNKVKVIKSQDKQLKEAKEIIKNMLGDLPWTPQGSEIINKAKIFIKEEIC